MDQGALLLLVAWSVIAALVVVLELHRRVRGPAVLRAAGEFAVQGELPPRQPLTDAARGLATRLRAALRVDAASDARIEALEEVLLKADVGVRSTERLLGRLRGKLATDAPEDAAMSMLAEEMRAILAADPQPAMATPQHVILVSGVNGVGKTTSVAKLAQWHQQQGRRVILVAADTFRAAAAQQLVRWGERIGCEVVHRDTEGTDPASVVYDGIQASRACGADVMIVDTAGRLHVKANLVAELQKISRTLGKQIPGAPHESLLVIDANTGQNAVRQAQAFGEALELTGVILTKLDGTAKGGAVLSIRSEVGLPIRFVGFGERVADFAEFVSSEFVAAVLKQAAAADAD